MSVIVQDVQKQEINSAKVTLWELEIVSGGTSPSSYAYFHDGLQDSTTDPVTTVTFRNRISPATINSYVAIPIRGEGFAFKADGPSGRPTISVANILATFSSELDGLTNTDLLGMKLYRRSTLYKYTYQGGSGNTSNPPIEFPIQMYIIDRVKEETPETVVFELSAGYDLEGVKLPRRIVTGSTCPWIYTGAAPELTPANKVGGCTWSNQGKIYVTNPAGVSEAQKINFINGSDEPVVPIAAAVQFTSGALTRGRVYWTTAPTLNKIQSTGIAVAATGEKDYWQLLGASASNLTTPSDDNRLWRRTRVYSAYSASAVANVFSLPLYSSYVLHSNRLWRAVNVTQNANAHKVAPAHNKYWELGDICSKSVEGCALRYRYTAFSSNSVDVVSPDKSSDPLQFGGFPGSRAFS